MKALRPASLLLAALLWLGLSLSALQLARIDLPDPQTRVDRVLAARGKIPTAEGQRLRTPPDRLPASAPPLAAVRAVGLLLVAPAAAAAVRQTFPVTALSIRRAARAPFAARAPPVPA